DDARPLGDVGQPADRAPRGVDEVEPAWIRQGVAGVVDVGVHEARAVPEPEFCGRAPRLLDRGHREVDADDLGAALREYEGVEPEMALQMQHALTRPAAGCVAGELRLLHG